MAHGGRPALGPIRAPRTDTTRRRLTSGHGGAMSILHPSLARRAAASWAGFTPTRIGVGPAMRGPDSGPAPIAFEARVNHRGSGPGFAGRDSGGCDPHPYAVEGSTFD